MLKIIMACGKTQNTAKSKTPALAVKTTLILKELRISEPTNFEPPLVCLSLGHTSLGRSGHRRHYTEETAGILAAIKNCQILLHIWSTPKSKIEETPGMSSRQRSGVDHVDLPPITQQAATLPPTKMEGHSPFHKQIQKESSLPKTV